MCHEEPRIVPRIKQKCCFGVSFIRILVFHAAVPVNFLYHMPRLGYVCEAKSIFCCQGYIKKKRRNIEGYLEIGQPYCKCCWKPGHILTYFETIKAHLKSVFLQRKQPCLVLSVKGVSDNSTSIPL